MLKKERHKVPNRKKGVKMKKNVNGKLEKKFWGKSKLKYKVKINDFSHLTAKARLTIRYFREKKKKKNTQFWCQHIRHIARINKTFWLN